MSTLEGQAPVPPEDENKRKVFRVNAEAHEGPYEVLKTNGLPVLLDFWKPVPADCPRPDIYEPVCVRLTASQLNEVRWEVVANYEYR